MTAEADPWKSISAARIPAESLGRLALFRDRSDIRVSLADGVAWVQWPTGDLAAIRSLLPIQGVQFFRSESGIWFPFGSRLPAVVGPPKDPGQPLAAVLIPSRFPIIESNESSDTRLTLRLVRDGEPRPTSGLLCPVGSLGTWTSTATTTELAGVLGARSGERVILLGSKLPSIPGAIRLYGESPLIPLGYRPDPMLPASAIREVAGAEPGELVVFTEAGLDRIPRTAFEPLTRAGIRLAIASVTNL